MAASSRPEDRADGPRKPLLGLRHRPGRLALMIFRLPLVLYQHGLGWTLGHTFLLLEHTGRKTGQRHSAVAQALKYDPSTREAVICAAWGPNTNWLRNIRARPAERIQIGRESFTPHQRFL